jgi:hypothetical protein
MLYLSLLLSACFTSDPAHDLADDSGAVDAKPDTAATSNPWGNQELQACGASTRKERTSGEGVLDPLYCVRVSPEPGDESICTDGTISVDTGGLFARSPVAPIPCKFYNLLGSVEMAGGLDHSAMLYCDGDTPGGVRFVELSESGDAVRSQLIGEDNCYADVDTGALLPTQDGALLAWIHLQTELRIVYGTVSADGTWAGLTGEVAYEGTPARLQAAATHLLVVDSDASLSAIPIAGDRIEGETLLLSSSAQTVTAATNETGFVAVSCDGEGEAPLVTAVDMGQLSWQITLEGSCGYDSRPAATFGPDQILIAWEADGASTVVWLDLSGEEQARITLKDAPFPRLLWNGEAYLLADAAGGVRTLTTDGEISAAWTHPDIVDHLGRVAGLRISERNGVWHFGLLSLQTDTSEVGHVTSFTRLR